jgi:hypothetical protein
MGPCEMSVLQPFLLSRAIASPSFISVPCVQICDVKIFKAHARACPRELTGRSWPALTYWKGAVDSRHVLMQAHCLDDTVKEAGPNETAAAAARQLWVRARGMARAREREREHTGSDTIILAMLIDINMLPSQARKQLIYRRSPHRAPASAGTRARRMKEKSEKKRKSINNYESGAKGIDRKGVVLRSG